MASVHYPLSSLSNNTEVGRTEAQFICSQIAKSCSHSPGLLSPKAICPSQSLTCAVDHSNSHLLRVISDTPSAVSPSAGPCSGSRSLLLMLTGLSIQYLLAVLGAVGWWWGTSLGFCAKVLSGASPPACPE